MIFPRLQCYLDSPFIVQLREHIMQLRENRSEIGTSLELGAAQPIRQYSIQIDYQVHIHPKWPPEFFTL